MEEGLNFGALAATREYFDEEMKKVDLLIEEDLIKAKVSSQLIQLVPKEIVSLFSVVPYSLLQEDGVEKLVLATHSQKAFVNINKICQKLNMPHIKVMLTTEENVRKAAAHYYDVTLEDENGALVARMNEERRDAEKDVMGVSDVIPIINKTEKMLYAAIQSNASDIHFRPTPTGYILEFRIHGHLRDVTRDHVFSLKERSEVVNIIKNKCEPKMDSSNITKEGGGSFKLPFSGGLVELRVSTVPLEEDLQKLNIRINSPKGYRKLDKLGYMEDDLRQIKKALMATSGLILTTGPTGAGKTTSLYAYINEVIDWRQEPLNVMTIEDPIEIHDERFCQIPVKVAKDKDLSFLPRDILRVCLRQDPDVLLIGEVRVREDAEVVIESSTTGHLVLSTVHSRDARSAVPRLLDMLGNDLKGSLLRELRMISSQRLLAVLCEHCSEEYKVTKDDWPLLTDEEIDCINSGKPRRRKIREGETECPYCKKGDGYTGRTAVVEYILFDNEFRDFLLTASAFSAIENELKRRGFRSMLEKAIDLVRDGIIELSEVKTIIGKEQKFFKEL